MSKNNNQEDQTNSPFKTLAFRSLWTVIPTPEIGVTPLTSFPHHFFLTLGDTVKNGFWIGLASVVWQRAVAPVENIVIAKFRKRPVAEIAARRFRPSVFRTFGACFLGVEVFYLLLFNTPPETSFSRLLVAGVMGGGVAGKLVKRPFGGVLAGIFFSLTSIVELDSESKEIISDFLPFQKTESLNPNRRPKPPTWRPAPPEDCVEPPK
mmetsp:Transcript_19467/g.30506  ORF Transcript_19467/g.30506 Transcript_19467/m.30506 type:complete len:208 (-) Transcript_19467:175-798(-)